MSADESLPSRFASSVFLWIEGRIRMIGIAIGIAIFGLAKNYWVALVGRMLWGLFDGTWSLMKTSTSEFCGEENVAMGLSLLTTGYGIGSYITSVLANQ